MCERRIIVDRKSIPNNPFAYFVLGFGGNGITFSVIGMDMVEAMLKDETHRFDNYFDFAVNFLL